MFGKQIFHSYLKNKTLLLILVKKRRKFRTNLLFKNLINGILLYLEEDFLLKINTIKKNIKKIREINE